MSDLVSVIMLAVVVAYGLLLVWLAGRKGYNKSLWFLAGLSFGTIIASAIVDSITILGRDDGTKYIHYIAVNLIIFALGTLGFLILRFLPFVNEKCMSSDKRRIIIKRIGDGIPLVVVSPLLTLSMFFCIDENVQETKYRGTGVTISTHYPLAGRGGDTQETGTGVVTPTFNPTKAGNAEAESLYELANSHLNQGNVAEAVKGFRKAAEKGFASAQDSLGWCYLMGDGVGKDSIEAVKWFKKAASQGNAGGQVSLGSCYFSGNGVGKDFAEAVKWFRKAAEQGDASGQWWLGMCYCGGMGVTRNLDKALELFRQAEQNDSIRETLRKQRVEQQQDNFKNEKNEELKNANSGIATWVNLIIKQAHETVTPTRMWVSDVKIHTKNNFPYAMPGTISKEVLEITVKWDGYLHKNGTTVLQLTYDWELNDWTDYKITSTDAQVNNFRAGEGEKRMKEALSTGFSVGWLLGEMLFGD